MPGSTVVEVVVVEEEEEEEVGKMKEVHKGRNALVLSYRA